MNIFIKIIFVTFASLFSILVFLGTVAYIVVLLERNDVKFLLKYKEYIEGETIWQRLLNIFKPMIQEKNSLASCSIFGKVEYYLPALNTMYKIKNEDEHELINLIVEVDEHEFLHKALFRFNVDMKYHHEIIRRMGVK